MSSACLRASGRLFMDSSYHSGIVLSGTDCPPRLIRTRMRPAFRLGSSVEMTTTFVVKPACAERLPCIVVGFSPSPVRIRLSTADFLEPLVGQPLRRECLTVRLTRQWPQIRRSDPDFRRANFP